METPPTETRRFLDSLFKHPLGPDRRLTVWDGKTKSSTHFSDFDGAVAHSSGLVSKGHETYYGVGLRATGLNSSQRGSKNDVTVLPGFWLDVDIAGPGHASSALPSGLDAGLAVIELCPLPPSIVVDSGGGLHAYWLFERAWALLPAEIQGANAASKQFQKEVIETAKSKLGYHVDQTGNIDRVLRLPGTLNFKLDGQPRPVTILLDDPVRYDMRLLVKTSSVSVQSAGIPGAPPGKPAPGTPAELQSRLQHLNNQGNRKFMQAVLAGQSFAAPGGRDAALQKATSIVAFVAPDFSVSDLTELFRPSIEFMAAESDDPENPALTLDDVAEKLTRALADARVRKEKNASFLSALSKKVSAPPAQSEGGRLSDTGGAGSILYQAPEAPTVYLPPPPPPPGDDLWVEPPAPPAVPPKQTPSGPPPPIDPCLYVIQHKRSYYVRKNPNGYMLPILKEELQTAVRDDLAYAEASGLVRLETVTKDGKIRRMNVQEIMDSYGTVARHARGSVVATETTYDAATDTLTEALCPPRDITPVFTREIDIWLRLLGGASADKLLDWVATIMRLDRQTSILYMTGEKSAGKNMLAYGLARLWGERGPTDLKDVLGVFNSDLAEMPLVYGDEEASADVKTSDFRRFVGNSSFTSRRKYLSNVSVEGCPRMIIADNGGQMMLDRIKESMSQGDIDATALKILHLEIDTKAVKFLESLGGREATNSWVAGDLIAAHALWLSLNRQVVHGNRFLVEGQVTSMARGLAVQGKIPSLMCEWITGYLNQPAAAVKTGGLAIIGDGKILINYDAISTYWSAYIKSEHLPPSAALIGKALGNMSIEKQRKIGTRRYHVVNPDFIYEWSDKNGVVDSDHMRERVERKTTP